MVIPPTPAASKQQKPALLVPRQQRRRKRRKRTRQEKEEKSFHAGGDDDDDSSSSDNEIPRKNLRRRRLRKLLPGSSSNNKQHPKNQKKTYTNVIDDSALAFMNLDENRRVLDESYRNNMLKNTSCCIPQLLEDRRTGGTKIMGLILQKNNYNPKKWQSNILIRFTRQQQGQSNSNNNNNNNNKINTKTEFKRQWLPMSKRSIPFRNLGTPRSDAVLALERNGSYVLSLGGSRDNYNNNGFSSNNNDGGGVPLALALRFYGVPSPSALLRNNEKQQQQNKNNSNDSGGGQRTTTNNNITTTTTTPLLQTTPLLYEIFDDDESPEETVFNFRRGISPATTPIKILISNDWRVGVAMFQPSNVWTEDGAVGNLVMFSLPDRTNSCNKKQSIFQCSNVRLGGIHASSYTSRNLFWRVRSIPQRLNNNNNKQQQKAAASSSSSGGGVFDSILHLPGYLFVNDEEDGFRFTWVLDNKWNCNEYLCRSKLTEEETILFSKGSTTVESIISFQETWEEIVCDRYSGEKLEMIITEKDSSSSPQHNNNNDDRLLKIVSECFFQVDVLLGSIVRDRKFSFCEFHYNLISIHSNGRVADLVIVFTRKQKSGSLGVFVQADIFTGCYQEQEWVKRKSLGTREVDASSLRSWCATLALNRRMKQKKCGPYSVDKKQTIDWSRLCIESEFDFDEVDDYKPEIWQDYVASRESSMNASTAAPKFISLSSLYPDCDLITNNAITSCLPVSSLRCKNSPTELIYG